MARRSGNAGVHIGTASRSGARARTSQFNDGLRLGTDPTRQSGTPARERRPPVGTARERETSADEAGLCQLEFRTLFPIPYAATAHHSPYPRPRLFHARRPVREDPDHDGFSRRGPLPYPLPRECRDREVADLLKVDDIFRIASQTNAYRLTVAYSAGDGGLTRAPDPGGMVGQGAYLDGPRVSFSGGAGILSTAADYARFLQMMLNGGKLGDARILSPKSVELMTVDHLGGLLVRNVNDTGALFGAEPGVGFGLGFRVVDDLGARGALGSAGEYGWGGAYHSSYWVDPQEELVVVYLAQLIPAGNVDDHAKFRALVYQAIDTAN